MSEMIRLKELEPSCFGDRLTGARVIHPMSNETLELCPIAWEKDGQTYYYYALLPKSIQNHVLEAQGAVG